MRFTFFYFKLLQILWLCGFGVAHGEVIPSVDFAAEAYNLTLSKLKTHVVQNFNKSLGKKSSAEVNANIQQALAYLESEDIDNETVIDFHKPIAFGLTWPHLAVMMQDEPLIRKLVDEHIDFTATFRSWLPAHFAAFHPNRDTLDLLEKLKQAPEKRNSFGGTPSESWSATHLRDPQLQQIRFHDIETGQTKILNGVEFEKLHGVAFIEEPKISPLLLLKSWLNRKNIWAPHIENDALQQGVMTNFQNLDKNSASKIQTDRLRLQVTPECRDQSRLSDHQQMELVAEKAIAKNTVVTSYAGMISVDSETRGAYATKIVDGIYAHGYGAFANDGFPNVGLVEFTNYKGLPVAEVLVAHEDIQPGQAIILNYLNPKHPTKNSKGYVEFRKEALNDWLEGPFHRDVERLYSPEFAKPIQEINKDAIGDIVRTNQYINYIISTPSVLVRLILEERFDQQMAVGFSAISKQVPKSLADSFSYSLDGLDRTVSALGDYQTVKKLASLNFYRRKTTPSHQTLFFHTSSKEYRIIFMPCNNIKIFE